MKAGQSVKAQNRGNAITARQRERSQQEESSRNNTHVHTSGDENRKKFDMMMMTERLSEKITCILSMCVSGVMQRQMENRKSKYSHRFASLSLTSSLPSSSFCLSHSLFIVVKRVLVSLHYQNHRLSFSLTQRHGSSFSSSLDLLMFSSFLTNSVSLSFTVCLSTKGILITTHKSVSWRKKEKKEKERLSPQTMYDAFSPSSSPAMYCISSFPLPSDAALLITIASLVSSHLAHRCCSFSCLMEETRKEEMVHKRNARKNDERKEYVTLFL